MTTINPESRKNTSFQTSSQVLQILHDKGLSKIFNWVDYEYFKKLCKNTFNEAQAIADLFTQYHDDTPSDFSDYVF